MSTAVFQVGAALFGACIGSFLNVVVYRLPQQDPSKRSLGGRSHCPHCGAPIRWYDNLPVLGWLLLRGKARCCGQRISVRYPAVELLTAVLFLLLARYPPNVPGTGASFGPALELFEDGFVPHGVALGAFVALATFLALLVACTFIDIDHYILPDRLTKPGMALGLLAGLWPGVAGSLIDDPSVPPAVETVLGSLAGLVVGGGLTWGIRILGAWAFKKEAMGFGDVKFMGMIGAFVGWQNALLTMFLACVLGAAFGIVAVMRRGAASKIPFGPYLALGAVIALFAGDPIQHFLFVTWPDWQRQSENAPWLLLVVGLASLVALFLLLRRARRT